MRRQQKEVHALAVFILTVVVFSLQAQFSYQYQTEVVHADQVGQALSAFAQECAIQLNSHLNQSAFFDARIITNSKKARQLHTSSKHYPPHLGQCCSVKTQDGLELGCTFFDRGSDRLLIVGSGLTNDREVMSPFVHMFPDYDLVLFDFRGHGYSPSKLFSPSTWTLDPIKLLLGLRLSLVHFGNKEHLDVFAVVDKFKQIKPYKQTFGLGICYSAFIFLKSLSLRPNLFDKLVLDGCWPSLPLFVDKIINKDPYLIIDPQKGNADNKWLFKSRFAFWLAPIIANNMLNLSDIQLFDYAKTVTKPVLFFYGKDDLTIDRSEFERLWQSLPSTNKTAIITSNPHVRNHLKQKEFYKLACDLFFQLPQQQFINCLQDDVALLLQLKADFDQRLADVMLRNP